MRSLAAVITDHAKSLVRHVYYVCGASTRKIVRRKTPFIVMYHGVDGETNRVEDLENQLLYLRRHFDIVPMARLTDERPRPAGKTPIVITFDDGLKNNHANVVPLLLKHRIPATFFVCPGLIDSGNWLWNHEARLRLASLDETDRRSLLAGYGMAGASVEAAIAWMKNQPIARRQEVERRIREYSPSFRPTRAQHAMCDIMSWQDLASLPELVTVGSHTNTHPILTSLGQDELVAEIADSKKTLETRLRRPVDYFCYPNGAINPEVVREVEKHYKAAVTVEVGYVDQRDDRYLLKRIPANPNMGLPLFAWRLNQSSHGSGRRT